MGNFIRSIFRRIFEFPIKRKPICFYRQEDFSSTGEPIKTTKTDEEQLAEYEQLVNSFYENLKAKRRMTKLMQEQNRRHSLKKILKKFPGWDEMTISNLHNLFLLFDDNKNAMLNLEDFCALLESLGDNSTYEVRSAKFEEADANKDGWITYDEFLPAIYNFDPPVGGVLRGLGKSCFEASENIRFVSNLTVGEQTKEYSIRVYTIKAMISYYDYIESKDCIEVMRAAVAAALQKKSSEAFQSSGINVAISNIKIQLSSTVADMKKIRKPRSHNHESVNDYGCQEFYECEQNPQTEDKKVGNNTLPVNFILLNRTHLNNVMRHPQNSN